jgi:hypothetical protein
MNYSVKITDVKTVDELVGAWSDDDFKELLKKFNYEDADKVSSNELKDYLYLAIADYEPNEAAAILLDYRLSDKLTEGQIANMSNEMEREKLAENYSDIYIHRLLFDINQLLFKAYNGKFPNSKATRVDFEAKETTNHEVELTKEIALKALKGALSDRSLVNRLFGDHLESDMPFPEAEGIVWELNDKGNHQYELVTSENWISEEDFVNEEYECSFVPAKTPAEED